MSMLFLGMAQTKLGARKIAAKKLGITLKAYVAHEEDGEKWCVKCKVWHPLSSFGADKTRGDGLSSTCLESRHTGNPIGWHGKPPINPKTGRPGPTRIKRRSGDKLQARSRINHDVVLGLRAAPNNLPCVDCGHIWKPGKHRHEYDHYRGYSAENHVAVEAVCSKCHHKREAMRRARKNKD